ncbi:bacteriohemerythrin [Hydrogenothermus marinus]|uniref:Hemerythrin n=1 Tax=Hydrogenothermus marinus TaxID=133270 RepID=A0A3M0B7H4_9AQUI|nr:hemerythrin family protein [Hydrogenothermus marinus]RMA93343.1 hemerythrin [Hydrogenothermus marinus]
MLLTKEELPKVALNEMNEIHFEEVDMINNLYDTAMSGDYEKTKKLFDEFIEHIEDHFSFEEDLMEQNEFFAYPMHKMEHDNVLKDLYNLREKFEKTKDTKLIANFLKEGFIPWLINHLNTMDTVTASFLTGGF